MLEIETVHTLDISLFDILFSTTTKTTELVLILALVVVQWLWGIGPSGVGTLPLVSCKPCTWVFEKESK